MPALSAAHVARALRPRAILLRLFEVINATNETHPASTATLQWVEMRNQAASKFIVERARKLSQGQCGEYPA